MTHTPGPWKFTHYLGMGVQEIDGPTQLKSGTHLASVYTTTGENDDPESIANACLIAAAPDFLAICKELLPYLSDENDARNHGATNEGRCSHFDVVSLKVRALIAKVEDTSNIHHFPFIQAWTKQDEQDDSRR
jgi:hypothetical protein